MTVRVEAPARLHLGMLDVVGGGARRFGGLGVAVSAPTAVVEASAADELTVEGPDAQRALAVARRCRERLGVGGARIRVVEAIPPHVGLGSGTKLALAVTAALAALAGRSPAPQAGPRLAGRGARSGGGPWARAGRSPDPQAVARFAGRGARSAVGLWTFALGGLVVEGGLRPEAEDAAP